MSYFNISESVDGELPNVFVLYILRVVSVRIINTRYLEEETTRAGLRAKREDVYSSNTERLAVSISVNIS